MAMASPDPCPTEEDIMLRFILAAALATSAASAAVDCGQAQSTPRTITLVVPFPAGGPTDAIGRIAADGLQSALGQPVIVENVPGATGSIGVGRVARAEADGYTLVLGTVATHVFNGAAYQLKYDVVKDFEPISLVAFDPQIIAVKKSLPVAALAQLITWLKASPGGGGRGRRGGRQPLARQCGQVSVSARHAIQVRALSWPRPRHGGSCGRPYRHPVRSGRKLRAAGP